MYLCASASFPGERERKVYIVVWLLRAEGDKEMRLGCLQGFSESRVGSCYGVLHHCNNNVGRVCAQLLPVDIDFAVSFWILEILCIGEISSWFSVKGALI